MYYGVVFVRTASRRTLRASMRAALAANIADVSSKRAALAANIADILSLRVALAAMRAALAVYISSLRTASAATIACISFKRATRIPSMSIRNTPSSSTRGATSASFCDPPFGAIQVCIATSLLMQLSQCTRRGRPCRPTRPTRTQISRPAGRRRRCSARRRRRPCTSPGPFQRTSRTPFACAPARPARRQTRWPRPPRAARGRAERDRPRRGVAGRLRADRDLHVGRRAVAHKRHVKLLARVAAEAGDRDVDPRGRELRADFGERVASEVREHLRGTQVTDALVVSLDGGPISIARLRCGRPRGRACGAPGFIGLVAHAHFRRFHVADLPLALCGVLVQFLDPLHAVDSDNN